jgi:hypothetical protein
MGVATNPRHMWDGNGSKRRVRSERSEEQQRQQPTPNRSLARPGSVVQVEVEVEVH